MTATNSIDGPAMDHGESQVELTDDTFETEICRAALPVLVEFRAEWSGGCHIMAPILESVAESLAGRIKVMRMNIEHCPRTAKQFGVNTVPTLLLFQRGELVESVSGLLPRSDLAQRVVRNLDETANTAAKTTRSESSACDQC